MQQKKKRKEEVYPLKAGASIGHTTNLRQSILRLSISMGAVLVIFLRDRQHHKNGREPVHALLKLPLDYLLNNNLIFYQLINVEASSPVANVIKLITSVSYEFS